MSIKGNEKLYVSEGSGLGSLSLDDIAQYANQAPEFTTAGGTVIPAGTIASQLKAIADLADPAGP